jgi:hypothetical protein
LEFHRYAFLLGVVLFGSLSINHYHISRERVEDKVEKKHGFTPTWSVEMLKIMFVVGVSYPYVVHVPMAMVHVWCCFVCVGVSNVKH